MFKTNKSKLILCYIGIIFIILFLIAGTIILLHDINIGTANGSEVVIRGIGVTGWLYILYNLYLNSKEYK